MEFSFLTIKFQGIFVCCFLFKTIPHPWSLGVSEPWICFFALIFSELYPGNHRDVNRLCGLRFFTASNGRKDNRSVAGCNV